jgi:cysteine dioxygenase
MPGITKEQDNFQSLVQALSDKLGPCSGIDSDDVDERELQQLMEDYTSNESEWSKYFFPSPHMAYTRNLVDKGNGKSNLVQYLCKLRRGWELTCEAAAGVVTIKGKPYP